MGTAAPEGPVMLWVVIGFASFFALDQLLEWQHHHRPPSDHVRPLGPLLLVADGVHNLLGGLADPTSVVVCAGSAGGRLPPIHSAGGVLPR